MTVPEGSVGPGVELGGRYRLYREIGRGGVARVWEARDLRLDRTVAVKTLMPGAHASLDRFEREARTAAALDHPALAGVLDVGHDGDVGYLVMPLVDGASLEDELEDGPLDAHRARTVIAAIAEGLAAAHRAGVVHRDVKPSNIMVPRGESPVLVDFGIARRVDAEVTGTVVGTTAYLAPEQLTGAPPTAAMDVYALGLVLLETLTGDRPFAAQDVGVRRERSPTVPRTLPDDLAELVRAATALEPASRPSAAAVAERLRAVAGGPRTRVLTEVVEDGAASAVDGSAPAPSDTPVSDRTTTVIAWGDGDDAGDGPGAASHDRDRAAADPPPIDPSPLVGIELPPGVRERVDELGARASDIGGRVSERAAELGKRISEQVDQRASHVGDRAGERDAVGREPWWTRGRTAWRDNRRTVLAVGALLLFVLALQSVRPNEPVDPAAPIDPAAPVDAEGGGLSPALEDALTTLEQEVSG